MAQNLMQIRYQCAKDIIEKLDQLPDGDTIVQQISDLTTALWNAQDDQPQDLQENAKKILEKLQKFPDRDTMHDLAMKILYDKTHDYFMAIASLAALRSKDPHTPIGACIVDTNNRVVGIGYNSMPYVEGEDNDQLFTWNKKAPGDNPLEKKHYFVIHAAVNAIINRTIPNLDGCTIYLTLHPDEDCAQLIAQSGIKRVLYWHRFSNRGNRHHEKKAMVISLLAEISVEKYVSKTEVQLNITDRQTFIREFQYDDDFLTELYSTIIYDHPAPVLFDNSFFIICQHCNVENLTLRKRLEDSQDNRTERVNSELVITWEEFFMGLAQLEKLYSNNDKDKVAKNKNGACIVNEETKQVLAIGGSGSRKDIDTVNRMEELMPSCGTSISSKDHIVQHAEYMAIASYKGTQSLRGCTMYCTTMPCTECAKLIAQTGIKRIVYKETLPDKDVRSITTSIFGKCNIELSKMEQKQILQINQVPPQITESLQWTDEIAIPCTENNKEQMPNIPYNNAIYWYTVEGLLNDRRYVQAEWLDLHVDRKKIFLTTIDIWVNRDCELTANGYNTVEICTNWKKRIPVWERLPIGHGYFRKQYYERYDRPNDRHRRTKLIYVRQSNITPDPLFTIRVNFQKSY